MIKNTRNSSDEWGFGSEKDILDFVLSGDRPVEFIRIMFPDVLGRPMDFTIPAAELEKAFVDGKGFDGSSIEGFVRIEESDLVIRPDFRTFRVLPWEYKGFNGQTAWQEAVMFGDIHTPDGTPFEGDSRRVLKRTLDRAAREFGMDAFKCGPELEFFIFPNNREPAALDTGGYFFNGHHGEIRKEIQLHLKRMGIVTEYDHHEVACGQHEIDLRYLDALEMADTAMLFRYMVKKVCRMHGLYGTFMPKPVNGQNGSGMHVHQSLWQSGRNVFFSAEAPYHLSDSARAFMAGLIVHSRETAAVFNQWVNSYKRLIEGYEAPVYICWGQKNRSAYIRVPKYQPGNEAATRIELRSPDPACNIYLALALMLAAGLEGIRTSAEPPAPLEESIYDMSAARRKKLGIAILPRNLDEAARIMEKSRLVRDCLGDHIFSSFLANKRREIELYRQHITGEFDRRVSDYEIRTYLPVL